MKPGNRDKLYIYQRDLKRCFYCGKRLKFHQITLDHYIPASKGGTNDIFNLVTCCKKCNKLKGDFLPEDYESVVLKLFLMAVKDDKIIGNGLSIDNKKLKEELLKVNRIEGIIGGFIFQSDNMRFYIKNNYVVKIVYIGGYK